MFISLVEPRNCARAEVGYSAVNSQTWGRPSSQEYQTFTLTRHDLLASSRLNVLLITLSTDFGVIRLLLPV